LAHGIAAGGTFHHYSVRNFPLGSAVIHRFDKREMSFVEDQLREIRVVEAQLAERTKDLERSNHDLAQFAYVASHDLRAPVRAMKSFAQILVKDYTGRLDAEADEHLGFIVDGANRLESLINDLLAYSRIDTQGKVFEPVDCSAVFDQVKTDLLMDSDHAEAAVTRDDLPTVMADGTQMVQLFQNLISNGIKFHGEAPPVVHMSSERNEKEWLFAVRDNGIGIEPEHVERIFAMFQRLHTQENTQARAWDRPSARKSWNVTAARFGLSPRLGQGALSSSPSRRRE